jgi:hypothetical protein
MLESAKGPVEVILIDRAEKPDTNQRHASLE